MNSRREPVPETMRVRVVDRGPGWRDTGVFQVVEVEVARKCLRCGRPRGDLWPVKISHRGAEFTFDRWKNPCGHFETSREVLDEAARRVAGRTGGRRG